MDKYSMPRHLDAPFRVFLLTIDELLLLILPILIMGMYLGNMITGFGIGIAALLAMKKIKGEQGHFYLVNLMYWYLPKVIKMRATPPSYIRSYLG